jgi:hypothetical protein
MDGPCITRFKILVLMTEPLSIFPGKTVKTKKIKQKA